MKYLTPFAFMAEGLDKGLLSIVERSPITLDSLNRVSSQMKSEFVMETVKFKLLEVSYMSVDSTFALVKCTVVSSMKIWLAADT